MANECRGRGKMKKSAINPATIVMSSAEFSRWAKTKDCYGTESNSIYDSTAFEKNGRPRTWFNREIFVPKSVSFIKSYYNNSITPAGWKKGAWIYYMNTVSGIPLYNLANVWNVSFNKANGKYYITKQRRW